MFSVAATSIGVRPTANVRNAGKVRCRAAVAAPTRASIGSMTGMRRQSAVDGLGVSRRSGSFHSVVARQTLAGGRVGKKFVVKAMFEVCDPSEVSPDPIPDSLGDPDGRSRPPRRSQTRSRGSCARQDPRRRVAGARARLRRRGIIGKNKIWQLPSDGTPSTRFLTLLFPPQPSLHPPALHREGHQGGHARPRGGPSPRPQLRRHRAGASTPRARTPTRCCSAAQRPDPLAFFPGS
jgi:hypothetical protein